MRNYGVIKMVEDATREAERCGDMSACGLLSAVAAALLEDDGQPEKMLQYLRPFQERTIASIRERLKIAGGMTS